MYTVVQSSRGHRSSRAIQRSRQASLSSESAGAQVGTRSSVRPHSTGREGRSIACTFDRQASPATVIDFESFRFYFFKLSNKFALRFAVYCCNIVDASGKCKLVFLTSFWYPSRHEFDFLRYINLWRIYFKALII